MSEIHSYTAGLIDGEGSILLTKSRENKYHFRYPSVSVSSTTPELVNFLKETYGGRICSHKTYKPHHKQSFSWSVKRNKALKFLQLILPFLKEPRKRKRAEFILCNYKNLTKSNGKYTEEQVIAKVNFETVFFSI